MPRDQVVWRRSSTGCRPQMASDRMGPTTMSRPLRPASGDRAPPAPPPLVKTLGARMATPGPRPVITAEGLPSQIPDIDPDETVDWLESLDGLLEDKGRG